MSKSVIITILYNHFAIKIEIINIVKIKFHILIVINSIYKDFKEEM